MPLKVVCKECGAVIYEDEFRDLYTLIKSKARCPGCNRELKAEGADVKVSHRVA